MDRNLTNAKTVSGDKPLDKMQNIYDLEGNYWELTAEACDTNFRARRGKYFDYIVEYDVELYLSASYRGGERPTDAYSSCSSRTGLYVNI